MTMDPERPGDAQNPEDHEGTEPGTGSDPADGPASDAEASPEAPSGTSRETPAEAPEASREEPPAAEEPAAPAAEPEGREPVSRRMLAWGAALVAVPGAVVAWFLARPMTIAQELGFPTMVPGRTGHSLHPSTTAFWIGVICLMLVGIGAGMVLTALFHPRSERPGEAPSGGLLGWLRRHAWSLSLLVIAAVVLLMTLGRAGLWDPWETHYGLVGLRMVEQDDWISTCDMGWTEWFFSKPILLFWLMGLGLVGLGQDAAADGNPPLVEWAFRLPIVLFALAAIMAVYLLASRRWGKRAGFISGLVLLTMPQFFLISRQAMTDMAFVAPLTVGLCMLALALGEPFERPAASFSLFRGRLRFNAFHLVVLALTVVSLPQALTVLTHHRDRALAVYRANAGEAELARLDRDHKVTDDVIIWGSLGQAEDGNDRCAGLDCSVSPGDPTKSQVNERFRPEVQISGRFPGRGMVHRFWGAVFLVIWLGTLVLMARRSSATVRGPTQRDVYLYGFYVAAGVATLAKGILGFALPGLLLLIYLAVSGDWREFLRLKLGRGIAIFLATAGPWYTMMVVRHGNAWFQQFIIHDHFKRSASGVHGDRGPLGYFVEQLGIGTFPWAGLIPAALVAILWIRWRREDPLRPSAGERTALFASLWALALFVFFTWMETKFHHYIFPAVPALALCVGLMLDRAIDDRSRWTPLVALGSLGLFAFVARDLTATSGAKLRGFERLIQLFMYKYDRAWPAPAPYGSHLDYSTEMLVFAAIFGVLLALFAVPGLRAAVTGGTPAPAEGRNPLARPRLVILSLLGAVAVVWAGWSLSVYFNQISPHWSEGYLVKQYYELRRGPEERLIAYSLNWHGENSYTANRAKILMTEHGFQPEWDDFPEWLKRHRGRTYYFILGKGGAEGLRSKLNASIPRAGETVEVVSRVKVVETDKDGKPVETWRDLSNKYDLARAALCAPEDCPPGTQLPSPEARLERRTAPAPAAGKDDISPP